MPEKRKRPFAAATGGGEERSLEEGTFGQEGREEGREETDQFPGVEAIE